MIENDRSHLHQVLKLVRELHDISEGLPHATLREQLQITEDMAITALFGELVGTAEDFDASAFDKQNVPSQMLRALEAIAQHSVEAA